MLGTLTSTEHLADDVANTDLGAAAAYELWDMLSPVKSCADTSEDVTRYDLSLFRFPSVQRQLLAALEYLRSVEANGHQSYFASTAVLGYGDAVACFQALGRADVVANLDAAFQSLSAVEAIVVGGRAISQSNMTRFDQNLAAANPIKDLFRFSRLHQLDFEAW